MTEQENVYFDMLRHGPCVDAEYVEAYYGLSWPLREDLHPDYERWLQQSRRPQECGDGTSRFELEGFLQQKGVVPKKWMGSRLGMTVESLDDLFANLDKIGMRLQRYLVYEELIADSFSEDLVPNLPGLKFRTFADHNAFCLRLHADLEAKLGLHVQPVFCATSERIQDYPRQFASHFDCITLAPLSGKHQMWLDFRKPLNLFPDRCSKLLYAENRDVLRPSCAGTQEPDDVETYMNFLAGHSNA